MKKNIFIVMLTAFVTLLGCGKESIDELLPDGSQTEETIQSGSTEHSSQDNDFEQFPAAVQNYVDINYPGAFVIDAEIEEDDGDTIYIVELNNDAVLHFNASGEFMGIAVDLSIDPADLPQLIEDYINFYYPTAVIEDAKHKANGNYRVDFVNGLRLTFNSAGDYLKSDFNGGEGSYVPVSSLPLEAANYINANFPGVAIEEVEQYDNGSYGVELNDDSELYFDQAGMLLLVELDNHLTPSQLPAPILGYLAENHPGATILEAELEDNGNYEVELSDGYELFFDSDGNIAFENDGYDDDDDSDELPIAQTPATIGTYIVVNYPDELIIRVRIKFNGNYEVRLSNGIKLFFNNAGNFLYEENEFAVEFSMLSFPDTVTIGQIVELSGFIANRSIYQFNAVNDIAVKYGIEDEMPAQLADAVQDGVEIFNAVSIPPNDSIPFTVSMAVTPDKFTPFDYDIAVVWPDVPTSTNALIIGGGYKSLSTFVKQN